MRLETINAWIFVGFGLLSIGSLLNLFQVAGQWGMFLAVMGIVYFATGMVLAIMHGRYMESRTRAGQERE